MALSAAEEAYLRRFVGRHALSGVAGRALVAGVLVALGLALWPAPSPDAPAPEASAQGFAAELAALRAEVAARFEPAAPDAATRRSVDELAQRIEAIAREIDAVRARAAAATPVPERASAPSPGGDAGLSGRIDDLELRQGQAEANRRSGEEAISERLAALESRLGTLPAAPQP